MWTNGSQYDCLTPLKSVNLGSVASSIVGAMKRQSTHIKISSIGGREVVTTVLLFELPPYGRIAGTAENN